MGATLGRPIWTERTERMGVIGRAWECPRDIIAHLASSKERKKLTTLTLLRSYEEYNKKTLF